MRGEDVFLQDLIRLLGGSPPHARGGPRSTAGGGGAKGITPACAGRTSTARCSCRCPSDHPRMRGEDDVTSAHR